MISRSICTLMTISMIVACTVAKSAQAVGQEASTPIEAATTIGRDGLLVDRESGRLITGTVVARFENGSLRRRHTVLEGRANGAWVEWHETGAIRLYAEWKAGLADGVWVYFHANGEISERAQVRDDIWDGVAEGWHANGQKAFESRFDRSVRPAPVRRWDAEGSALGPWVELIGMPAARFVLAQGWPPDTPLWDFSFTPDLETLFVATGQADGNGRQILIRRWRDGIWSAPVPAPFSDPTAAEGTPVGSPDGRYVYFSSDRHRSAEPDNPNRELYRASAASGWRTVERVTNTPAYGEVTLSLAKDGRGVLWTDRLTDGEARIGLYEVRLIDAAPAPTLAIVGSLNDLQQGDPSNENSAAIAEDGSFIIFANYNVEAKGTGEDLYLACRTANGWGRPSSLGPGVNTSGTESSPQIIGGGRTLVWRHEASSVQELRVISLGDRALACGRS